jgi:CUB/sushi domain-containing protein
MELMYCGHIPQFVCFIALAAILLGDVSAMKATPSYLRQSGGRPSKVDEFSSALDNAMASAQALLHSHESMSPTVLNEVSAGSSAKHVVFATAPGFQAGSVGAAPVDYNGLSFPAAHNINPKRCPTGHARLGCMSDGQTKQQRWYREVVPKMDRLPMTPELCFDFCKNVSGVQFFGLKGGNDCYCTPFFQDVSTGGGECEAPCEGDNTRTCGGVKYEEVFSMHDCSNMPILPCKKLTMVVPFARMFKSRYYRKIEVPCMNSINDALKTGSTCDVKCIDGYELVHNSIKCVTRGDALTYAWGSVEGSARCAPKNCGVPTPVNFSIAPQQPVFFPNQVSYDCNPCFSTTGNASGPRQFITSCTADGIFSLPKACKRVTCGYCTELVNAKVETPGEHFCGSEECSYSCNKGYTLDQLASTGVNAKFNTRCLPGGNFNLPRSCLPVSCGLPPSFETAMLADDADESISKNAVLFPTSVTYKCKEGYSLTQLYEPEPRFDLTLFNLTCLADAFLTRAPECKPIICGKPPDVKNSFNNAMKALVYKETVTYTCDDGYTHSGVAGETKQETIACGPEGQFLKVPKKCLPVKCGEAPQCDTATVGGHEDKILTFDSLPLDYSAVPGYSLLADDDPYAPQKQAFTVTCQANGIFTPCPPVLNINDCLVHQCGDNGECVDKEKPTGVPFDDYSCQCNSGYEETLHNISGAIDLEKICTNINDCPTTDVCGGPNPEGFLRGICEDMINNYTCRCSTGYDLVVLPAIPDNLTCTPKSCGPVPGKANATSPLPPGFLANYDTPDWNFTCDKGYTLDGTARGLNYFEVRCASSGLLEGLDECLPVSCGPPPVPEFANSLFEVDELKFPNKVKFECDEGYSTDRNPKGIVTFDVTCTADGSQSGQIPCLPVECGKVPEQAHALYDTERVFTFGEEAKITCDIGYSTDTTSTPESKNQSIACLSNGSYEVALVCKRIACGSPPLSSNTTVSDEHKFYMDTAEYILDLGFSLNGNISGNTSFEVTCQADSTFSALKVALPVSCGVAPKLTKATNPGTSHVFATSASYSCNHGYTTDGQASGPKGFSTACLATGKYEVHDGCKPVTCGSIEPLIHAELLNESSLLGELVFDKIAHFQCKPGYSVDGRVPTGDFDRFVKCQANGQLIYPSPCVNDDNCAEKENMCAPHGSCVDSPTPTGNRGEDLSCACDSGFAENVSAYGVHSCYNIPDCPAKACLPGSCHDLVNDYNCSCPEGYFLGPNPQKDLPHDCLPVPCGVPEVFENTILAGGSELAHSDIVFTSPPLNYSCSEGYSLDGFFGGETDFSVRCLANRSFAVAPVCKPVTCGLLQATPHASYPKGETRVFPNTADYSCVEGYSLDAMFGPNTQFQTSCQANGTYAKLATCLAIKCPPLEPEEYVTVDFAGKVLAYPEEQPYTCAPGYALDENKHGENTYSLNCRSNGEVEFTPGTPNGPISRCVPISCGPLPRVQHGSITGGVNFGTIATITCDEGYSVDHTTNPRSKTSDIACQTTGAFSSAMPCLKIECTAPPEVANASFETADKYYFQQTVSYALHEGFTLDGTATGLKSFTVTCQASGMFSHGKTPKPVKCGLEPRRLHATSSGASRVFPQLAPYTCVSGYSTDGKASGPKTFELSCTAGGTYTGLDGCKPVECGSVAVPDKSKQIPDGPNGTLSELVFKQRAAFECLPGFTTNGTLNGPKKFFTKCQASGEITSPPVCQNANDCVGRLNGCSPHGRCFDHEDWNVTGEHKKDFHCNCDPGFKENVTKEGVRSCGNIPDCPIGACLPGSCKDLVQDYKCLCPDGYYEGPNPAESLKHDCLAVSCGTPPTLEHAKTSVEEEVFFDSDPVPYICDLGYSLDGSAEGDTNFDVQCLANKSFAKPPTCKPVVCGEAPAVEYASVEAKTYVFPEQLSYACAAGYSLDGTAAGPKSFEASCTETGEFEGVVACVPVACPLGSVSFGENATYDVEAAESLVFPESVVVTCLPGYALNKDAHTQVTYSVTCKDDGSIYVPESACTPIDCGPAPEVRDATVAGSTRFGGKLTATGVDGYSLDGSVQAKTSDFQCTHSGQFSPQPTYQRVKCGKAATVANTQWDKGDKVFEDKVEYTLDTGHSLDGTAAGPKKFSVTCRANGTFSPVKSPKPISCGIPPVVSNATSPGIEHVFGESASYTCDAGFTTTGVVDGPATFTAPCSPDGNIQNVKECKPVACDALQAPEHSTPAPGSKSELVYGEHAVFVCKPGWSTDGVVGSGLVNIKITCQAAGTNFVPASCKNNDDCASPQNSCAGEKDSGGPDGTCVDHPEPTGDHMADFHCECKAGFKEQMLGLSKSCENIDDCAENLPPTTALRIHTCDVSHAQSGNTANFKIRLSSTGSWQSLSSIGGGFNRNSWHATTIDGEMSNFDLASSTSDGLCIDEIEMNGHAVHTGGFWLDKPCTSPSYSGFQCIGPSQSFQAFKGGSGAKCDPGMCHDLISDFNCSCPAGYLGTSANPPFHGCGPRSCGVPPAVEHAKTEQTMEALFNEPPVQYSCDTGYTLDKDGIAGSETSFSATCQANGSLSKLPKCFPVVCGEAPVIANATSPSDVKKIDFPTVISYTCDPGFHLGGPFTSVDFEVTCTATGAFDGVQVCLPITGPPENIILPNTKHEETVAHQVIFPGSITVECVKGFALNKDEHDSKTSTATLDTTGNLVWSPSVQPQTMCVPIDCGQAPIIPHATISGSTLFGDVMVATAETGWSLDGTPNNTVAEFRCLDSGEFSSPLPVFQKCKCQKAPAVQHVAEVILLPAAASASFLKVGNARGLAVRRTASVSAHVNKAARVLQPTYMDDLNYKCKEGYRADVGGGDLAEVSDPKTFTLRCHADADLKVEKPTPIMTSSCVPIACSIESGVSVPGIMPTFSSSPVERIAFGTSKGFQCQDGFSVDGTPTGGKTFSEVCQANGSLSNTATCKDIDYCLQSQCEVHNGGYCIDGSLDYSCACYKGFETDLIAGAFETCVDINECVASNGNWKCGGGDGSDFGTCVDANSTYTCNCNSGYEQIPEDGHDSCQPVTCDPVPVTDHMHSDKEGLKLAYTQTASYLCGYGYTLDGTVGGEVSFDITCQADRTYTEIKQCLPISCGSIVTVDKATPSSSAELRFGENVTYTCDEGYTMTGHPSASTTFNVACLATGQFSAVNVPGAECLPVKCSDPPMIAHALSSSQAPYLLYKETASYKCNSGFTLTGDAGSASTFEIICNLNGGFDGQEECLPVKCGAPEQIPNAIMPSGELAYPDTITVECSNGYTLDSSPAGPKEYMIQCMAEGGNCIASPAEKLWQMWADHWPKSCEEMQSNWKVCTNTKDPNHHVVMANCPATCAQARGDACTTWPTGSLIYGGSTGAKPCKPVSCGEPPVTDRAIAPSGSIHYGMSVTLSCKEGFSVDGKPSGLKTFTRQCEADGSFSIQTVNDCQDIDFCLGGTRCGANGECADSGEGVPFPGYTCTCAEGYEAALRDDGSPYCTADDCAGDPCGPGGACTDISKIEQGSFLQFFGKQAAPDQYSCSCHNGYEHARTSEDQPTCVRIPCSPYVQTAEQIPSVSTVDFAGYTNVAPEFDVMTGAAMLLAFDSATYTCADGYSTDGSTSPGSSSFTLTCEPSGKVLPFDTPNLGCVPVKCEGADPNAVPNAQVLNAKDSYVFQDEVSFQCDEGHTLTGIAGGEVMFQSTCDSSGIFQPAFKECKKVRCSVTHTDAKAQVSGPFINSPSGKFITYSSVVTYTCLAGFTANVDDPFATTYSGTCKTNGKIELSNGGEKCKPVVCGAAPEVQHAEVCKASGGASFIQRSVVSRKVVLKAKDRFRQKQQGTCSPADEVMTSVSPAIEARCYNGYMVNGLHGAGTEISINCKNDGEFNQITDKCEKPRYTVKGQITSAVKASIKIKGASIIFTTGDGSTVAEVTTDHHGQFSAQLPGGTVRADATKSGYITTFKDLHIESNIHVGGQADLSMSEELPEGQWRIVLEWAGVGAGKLDLDSHTKFAHQHSYWANRNFLTDHHWNTGITAILDRDDLNGDGAETTTLGGIGMCDKGTEKCKVTFMVRNYRYAIAPSTWTGTKGTVKIYAGQSTLATFSLDPPGKTMDYNIFTIDASTGDIYSGSMTIGPHLDEEKKGYKNWQASFDSERWSLVPTNAVVFAITASKIGPVHNVEYGHYYEIQNPGDIVCPDYQIDLTIPNKWSTCPTGYFMKGLFRSGVKQHSSVDVIKSMRCCRAQRLPEEWGGCVEIPSFTGQTPEGKCPNIQVAGAVKPTALVGLHRGSGPGDSIAALDKFKCCAFAAVPGTPYTR